MKIFISYTSSDKEWAHWIAWQLRSGGHQPFVHEWEIDAGQNIPRWMEERLGEADGLVGVFSDTYCDAIYSQGERWAALWQDPDGRRGFLIPIEARKVTHWPIFVRPLKRLSLVGLNETEASVRLIEFLKPAVPPSEKPAYPGNDPVATSSPKQFAEGSEPLDSTPPNFPAAPIEDKSAEAGTLSIDREAFLSVAGNSFRNDPDLFPLLATLGGHALTIRLVAAQAIGLPSLKGLRETWDDAHAAILPLSDEAEGLGTSLRASLVLSLNSRRMKATPLARRLLAIVAVLPDGLAESVVPSLLGDRGVVSKAKAQDAILCLFQLRLVQMDQERHLRVHTALGQYVQQEVAILHSDQRRLEKFLERQERKKDRDEVQTPRTSRAKLAEVASPAPFLLPDGRLDARLNSSYDVPIDSPDLPTLPIRQLALIEIIVGDLPRNAPKHLKTTLSSYRDELLARVLNPIWGLLKDMAAIIDAAAGAPNSKREWLDAGMIAAFERFDANHELFLRHFPLDPKRETLYAVTPVDEQMATGTTLSKPFEEVAKASGDANKAGLTTDDFVKIVDKMTEFAKVIASQLPPPQTPNKSEPTPSFAASAAPIIRPEDRINREEEPVSPKKQIVLSGIGFLERAYNLLGSSATLMGPPEGNALLNALRAAIAAFSKLLRVIDH